MFYVIWKAHWRPKAVYAVNPAENTFLVTINDNFMWLPMDEFLPVD